MADHGAVFSGIADAQLEGVFCEEWINLDSQGRNLVMRDFLEAVEEDELSAREYQRRIGRGNLAAYARVMAVRYAREDRVK